MGFPLYRALIYPSVKTWPLLNLLVKRQWHKIVIQLKICCTVVNLFWCFVRIFATVDTTLLLVFTSVWRTIWRIFNLNSTGIWRMNLITLINYNIQSTKDDSDGFTRSVQMKILYRFNHLEYKRPSVYRDISLYKQETAVEYTRPICLQTEHQFPRTYFNTTARDQTKWREVWLTQQDNVIFKLKQRI